MDKVVVIEPDGANLEAARNMADDVINLILNHFAGLGKQKVFAPVENAAIGSETEPLSWEQTLAEMRQVLRHSMQVAHPRFFGHMDSGPLYISVLADWVASTLNQNMLTWELSPLAATIEDDVIQWFYGLCGYTKGEGTLVSGGTMANFTGLLLALQHATDGRFRQEGVWAFSKRPVIFASEQAHYSIAKAAASAGLGELSVVKIDTDSAFRMDVKQLEDKLQETKATGQIPVMVVATAGTTSTGSVDPIMDIASLCKRYGVWLHVDAAHGGAALFSSQIRSKIQGMEQADSITIDPHKWLMQPKSVGMILTRHDGSLHALFQSGAPYLSRQQTIQTSSRGSMTFQGSRRFDAFRLWITRKYLGDEQIGILIDNGIRQAKEWANLLRENGNFELAHEPDLNLLCFRFRPQHISEHELDTLNEGIQQRLMRSGKGFVSLTTLKGRRWMRSVFLNPATTTEDMLALMQEMERLAQK